MFRLSHSLGVLLSVLALGSCEDHAVGLDLPSDGALRRRVDSQHQLLSVLMTWDDDPAQQPAGSSLSGTASFEVRKTGEVARDVEVVEVWCDMICCGSRASKTPQWERGATPDQVRIWDIQPDSSGVWRVVISARVDGNKAENVDFLIRIP